MPQLRQSVRPQLRQSVIAFVILCFAGLFFTSLGVTSLVDSAHADEVSDLVSLAQRKPSGMDRDTWREKRRDAVKKLGDLRDKRAVDVLINIVRTEEFDAVAEYAVVSLGKLRDKKAVPVLNSVVNDKSRDRHIRGLARTALAKLGSKPVTTPKTNGTKTGLGTGTSTGTVGAGSSANQPVPDGPKFSEDTLSATERLRFALGSARLEFDTLQKRPSISGNVAGSYEHTVQTKKKAWRYALDAGVVGGLVDPDGASSSSQLLTFTSLAAADMRMFLGDKPYYIMGEGAVGATFTRIRTVPVDAGPRVTRVGADLHLGLRLGYGRIYDKGEALRLKRIEKLLREGKNLGRPITGDLAERILRTWWALRGERGMSRRLLATVKILREAGVLLGEPAPLTTYKILQVLGDGQLNHRQSGWDANIGVNSSFLVRDDDLGLDDGRLETAVIQLRYGKQNDSGTQELIGNLAGRYHLSGGDSGNEPFAVGATAAWRNYRYANTYDPLGALEIAGEVTLAEDGNDTTNLALRLGGRIGWLWAPSRFSSFRLSASLAVEAGEIFVGANFEAAYGFLDVGFIGRGAY